MKQLLDDLERALTDLYQMGLATAGPDMAARMQRLADTAGAAGFHTGAALFAEISRLLTARSHSMDKTNADLTAAVCRAEHYITLCRQRLTEEDIRRRWRDGGIT